MYLMSASLEASVITPPLAAKAFSNSVCAFVGLTLDIRMAKRRRSEFASCCHLVTSPA